jgi:hypothetical protein
LVTIVLDASGDGLDADIGYPFQHGVTSLELEPESSNWEQYGLPVQAQTMSKCIIMLAKPYEKHHETRS